MLSEGKSWATSHPIQIDTILEPRSSQPLHMRIRCSALSGERAMKPRGGLGKGDRGLEEEKGREGLGKGEIAGKTTYQSESHYSV